MSLSAGDIVFDITGDITGLNSAMQQASASASANFGNVSRAVGGAMAAGGAAITGFAAMSIMGFTDTGDALAKMNDRTGLSIDTLSRLKSAADESDGSITGIGNATKRFATTLTDAREGTTTAIEALGRLGLTVDDYAGKNPDQIFMMTADAIAAIEDPTLRSAAAQGVWGRAGNELLPMLAGGTQAFHDLMAATNRVFTPEDTAKAVDYQNAQKNLFQSLAALSDVVAVALVPKLTELMTWVTGGIERFTAWAAANPGLTSTLVEVGAGIGAIMTVIGPMLIMLPGLTSLWTLLAGAIPLAGAALVALTGPVGIVIGIIGALALAAWYFVDDWGAVWDTVAGIAEAAAGVIVTILQPIFDMIGWILRGLGLIGQQSPVGGIGQERGAGDGNTQFRGDGNNGGGGLGQQRGGGGVNIGTLNVVTSDPNSASRDIAQALYSELAARGLS